MDEVKNYPPYLDYPKPYKPLTNADRVRAMSDEELAAWAINEAPKIGFRYTSSETGLLKWLKQPAEENENGRYDDIPCFRGGVHGAVQDDRYRTCV